MDLDLRRVSGTSSSTFYCWAEDPREASMHDDVFSMTVNREMVNYFSQPEGRIDLGSFVAIYCANPLKDDDCPVGVCPNPDIAGPLVRIAHYVTAFCLTILIFHAPKRVKDVFYYQISTIYALLITCSVSLFQENITRFHATIAIFIASSPVSFYFLVYSIRSFWDVHRLDEVLGGKKYLNRGLVFLAAGIWTSIVVYTSLGSTQKRFAQGSCKVTTVQEVLGLQGLIGAPSVVISAIAVISWIVSILLVRREIWPPGERYRPKFVTVWQTIGRRYPYVFFMTVGIIPISIWIWTTELTVLPIKVSQPSPIYDSKFSFSFGQILALFIAVPPFLQTCQLIPRLWSWVINLAWIACCWKRKRRTKPYVPAEKPDPSHEAVGYTHLDNPVQLEDQSGTQEIQEPVTRIEPNRYYGP